MSEAARMAMGFRYVLASLRPFWTQFFDESSIVLPVELGCDNSGSIKYSEKKAGVASRLKRIDVRDAMTEDFWRPSVREESRRSRYENKMNLKRRAKRWTQKLWSMGRLLRIRRAQLLHHERRRSNKKAKALNWQDVRSM
ncbi:unnamed protein product [Amoebophrya sp. A25]|nr:unnamed protein product [Amoebophrya sp. A25]|eukprot:GSA25T00016828001.1